LDVPISYVLDFSTLPPGSLTVAPMGVSENLQLAAQTAQAEAVVARNAANEAIAAKESATANSSGYVSDYEAIRAYSGAITRLYVTGVLGTTAPSGIAGNFVLDESDTTSSDNGGTIIVAGDGKRWKRQYGGTVSVEWFGADSSGVADCSSAVQKAIDVSNGRIDFGATGTFRIAAPVGFPANIVASDRMMMVRGDGASIIVDCAEAIFTSKDSLLTPESTSNLYAAKINITGLAFKSNGSSPGVVINGDRLYNVMCYRNSFFGTTLTVIKAFRDHGGGSANGYMQSVAFDGNHFAQVGQIVNAKRAFNIVFVNNHCESCLKGIYIDGTGDPAVNVLRVENNLWEGGGVFLKLGSVLGYSIHGNYFEGNSQGDVPTLKCIIYMVRSTGGYSSGGSITCNGMQVSAAYTTDTDYRDIKFSGSASALQSLTVAQPVVSGNWTNSYQFISEDQVFNQFGNGTKTAGGLDRWNSPKLHTEARVSYSVTRRAFDAATYLSSGAFTVCEISTTQIKALAGINNRPMTAELNLFLQQKTAGGVVTGACVAKVLLVVQGAEGSNSASASSNIYVGGSLVSFAEIPSGSIFDTTFNSAFQKHFTNPALTIVANGADNYYLKLSGYAAPTTANYGPANQILSHQTLEIFGLNNSAALAGQLRLV